MPNGFNACLIQLNLAVFFSQKIRAIYNGSCTSLGPEAVDLPVMLPRPPVVGMKIYARVRSPKDGIYAGTVDAVIDDGYRVVFDKEEMIPPCIVKVNLLNG